MVVSTGWAVALVDVNGEVVPAILGVVPLSEGPGQVAQDGEDDAVFQLPCQAFVVPGVIVHIGCSATLAFARRLG